MRVNLDGTFHAVWRAKDGMVARGYGRIVCISSVLGLVPNPDHGRAHDRLWHFEGGHHRVSSASARRRLGPAVRVNGVAPGYVATDMTADVSDEARTRLIAKRRRSSDSAASEEIAELVHFLLSERSSFTTGQTHVADGGYKFVP